MKDRLKSLVAKYKDRVDYLEIRFEKWNNTSFSIKDDEIESVKQAQDEGGAIRVLHNGSWAFAAFNDVEKMEEVLSNLVSKARLLPRGEAGLAEVEPVEEEVTLRPEDENPSLIPLKEKLDVMLAYNKIVRDYGKNITNSSVRYFDYWVEKYYVNSEGTYIYQPFADMGFGVSPIARKDGDIQSSSVHDGGKFQFKNKIYGREKELVKCCDLVNELIDAPPVKGGEYTVVLDPFLTGIFTHESFGHTAEADSILTNPSLKEVLKLGRRFGSDVLSIYDSGIDYGTRGYLKYDDEGVKTEKTYLIKNGILVGRLHSRETAYRLGEKPTGNARAINYRFPPIVRMRNTAIEGGNTSFQDMIRDIKEGVYCIGSVGGTGGESFTFTANYGIMIKNGKLDHIVKNVKLMGNLYETLKNISMVGNDFTIPEAPGGCGKMGQFPLPVSHSGPHIRIEKVCIGGEK